MYIFFLSRFCLVFVFLFLCSRRSLCVLNGGVGGGGYAARLFLLFSFPCSADHEERDWPRCKVVFSGWQFFATGFYKKRE